MNWYITVLIGLVVLDIAAIIEFNLQHSAHKTLEERVEKLERPTHTPESGEDASGQGK